MVYELYQDNKKLILNQLLQKFEFFLLKECVFNLTKSMFKLIQTNQLIIFKTYS